MMAHLHDRTVTPCVSTRRRPSNLGHALVLAQNGQEAVHLFRAVAPDLVLMDIEMPVMNGFEAAARIRAVEATQRWAWTPIIFLTASDTEENLITAIKAGGYDCLRSVAATLAQTVAADNTQAENDRAFAAHYGGEAFAAVLPMADAERTARMAQALVHAVHALDIAHEKNAGWGRVTISVGGSHLGVAEGKIADLFRSADKRLYEAKESGRNRAVV
jgi:diguanylate cyclase (GGDEF)-like protein